MFAAFVANSNFATLQSQSHSLGCSCSFLQLQQQSSYQLSSAEYFLQTSPCETSVSPHRFPVFQVPIPTQENMANKVCPCLPDTAVSVTRLFLATFLSCSYVSVTFAAIRCLWGEQADIFLSWRLAMAMMCPNILLTNSLLYLLPEKTMISSLQAVKTRVMGAMTSWCVLPRCCACPADRVTSDSDQETESDQEAYDLQDRAGVGLQSV